MNLVLCLRQPVLAALLTTSTVVTIALVWFGLRNLQQESAMERQRTRERLENGADAMAAGLRGKLAETGERLSRWISNASGPVPAMEGVAVVASSEGRIQVAPPGALPFVPVEVGIEPPNKMFAEAESIEFAGNHPEQAAEMYRKLSRHANPGIRAEALFRLGRMLRKTRQFERAMEAYRALIQVGNVTAGGLPAELVGLDGQRLTQEAGGDEAGAQRIAAQIARFIDSGRWLLPRGPAEFYRDAVTTEPKSESWLLAEAMASMWEAEAKRRPSSGTLRVIEVQSRPVLGMWRSNASRTAALVAFAERFIAQNVAAGYTYQLTDAAEERLAGASSIPSQTVARVIGDPQNPWMLRIWSEGTARTATSRLGPQLLLPMLAVVILFLWGTVYFMARAIRREARVARLQSDFVAAVSHEFRSPLTTVRQLSEMLEMDQVPTEDRRRKYYHVLAAEARRLHRLVETVLNFGKMEAGAQQYRFEKLDVRELVGRAVQEASGNGAEASCRIRIMGPQSGIHVWGDADALTLALRNLVDNGLKYSQANEEVEVQWNSAEGRVSISVVDHGSGIPAEEQQAIFQKFVRGRAAIEGSVKGTGVGLAIVRHILSAHGGQIRLASELGRGSTFTIVLAETT